MMPADAPTRRWLSFFTYLMFVGVGVTSTITPLVTFTSSTSLVITYLWSGITAFGGLLGCWGIIKKSPLMEFYGLPLQFSCIAVFGMVALVRGVQIQQWGSIAVGMMMLALTAKLLARWWDIARLIKMLERRRDERDD
jgi:hypothetical protein